MNFIKLYMCWKGVSVPDFAFTRMWKLTEFHQTIPIILYFQNWNNSYIKNLECKNDQEVLTW